jgi:hypothetical protein
LKANIFVLLASTIILSACALIGRVDPNDYQAVISSITTQHDDFKKQTNYRGPNVSPGLKDDVFIRAWKADSTGSISYQIYVKHQYDGKWRFYNSADDSNGNSLDTTLISRDVGLCYQYLGCELIEHLGFNVTRNYLEANQASGVSFKVSGKAGQHVFFIPSSYVKAFLTVVK